MTISIILGCAVIIAAAVLQEYSEYWSGLISVMPLKVLVVLFIVWNNNGSEFESARGMVSGVVGTVIFLVVFMILDRLGLKFIPSIIIGLITWCLVVWLSKV